MAKYRVDTTFTGKNGYKFEYDAEFGVVHTRKEGFIRNHISELEFDDLTEHALHAYGVFAASNGILVFRRKGADLNGEVCVIMINPETGEHEFAWSNEYQRRGDFTTAAMEYLEAHPAKKPWRDAKEGEVWLLKLFDGRTFRTVVVDDEFVGEESVAIKSTRIKNAERLLE